MRDRSARTLEFAARMQKRRRIATDESPSPDTTEPLETVRLEALKTKALSMFAGQDPSTDIVEMDAEEAPVNAAEQMAVLSARFEPAELAKTLEIDGAVMVAALSSLAPRCSIEASGEHTYWLLHGDNRSASLQWLAREGRLAGLLAGPLPSTDHTGEVFRKILRGETISLDTLALEDLLAVSWSMEALDGVDVPKPEVAEVRRLLARTQFLAGYEVLLEKEFVGRDAELARLSSFLRSAVSGHRMLLLSGLGGAGKSTLLAKFARETATMGNATVVVLDFDRPGIDGRDTLWLEMEMARQVGAQYPEYDQMLRQAREDVRKTSTDEREGKQQYSAGSAESARGSRAGVLYPIADILRNAAPGGHFCWCWIRSKKWLSEN